MGDTTKNRQFYSPRVGADKQYTNSGPARAVYAAITSDALVLEVCLRPGCDVIKRIRLPDNVMCISRNAPVQAPSAVITSNTVDWIKSKDTQLLMDER